MTSRTRTVIGLVLVFTAGCGRREKPAWFDAAPPVVAVATEQALPASALKVRWGRLSLPATIGANSSIAVTVSLTNAGDMPWPNVAAASPRKDGSYAVRLTHKWLRTTDPRDDRLGAERGDLPRSVAPGDSIDVPLTLQTPAEPGEYTLVIELVQELVQWFADKGADRIMLPARVVPGAAPTNTPSSK